MTNRLHEDLIGVLGLKVGVTTSGVSNYPCRVSSRPKGQVGGRIGIWKVGGEVGGRCEVGHVWKRCLRLVLTGGVRRLELVRESVVRLTGCRVVELLRKIKE